MSAYVAFENVRNLIEIQPESIVSRTIHKGEGMKAVLFGFDAGQALSEHTSTYGAVIQVIEGEILLTLGEDAQTVTTGGWVYMQPRLIHSVHAKTPVVMLLTMFEAK